MVPNQDPNENSKPKQQYDNSALLLQHFHVDSVQQLIQIMINPIKSQAYISVRSHPVPHIDLQNFTTIKSSIQYKRQLLLNLFYQAHLQMKDKLQLNNQVQPNSPFTPVNIHSTSNSNANNNNKIKNKISKESSSSSSSQTQSQQDFLSSSLSNYNIKPMSKSLKLQKQISQLSVYSYEQLQSFFKTNTKTNNNIINQLLCSKILKQKYKNFQIIPAHKIRKQFWLLLIAVQKKRVQYLSLYQNLNNYQNYRDFYSKIIHADVIRTVHQSDQKIKKQLLQSMEKILITYARKNPYIGYCQGMNFILNFIITMGFDEQQCFWMLSNVLQQIVPFGYFTNMSGVAVDIKIISIILQQIHPIISKKFKKLQIDLSIFMLQWLVCLFTSTLPFYLLVIVWDLMLIQGSVALIKTSLVLLELLQPIIQESADFAHFFALYENFKQKSVIDQQSFIRKYNLLYIDGTILPLVRQIVQNDLKRTKQQLRKEQKPSQKWKQTQCDQQWPICFQQLRKQKYQDMDVDIWIFRDYDGPRMINDYLTMKQNTKKSQNLIQDGRDPEKKLVIGRIPHICQSGKSGKIKWKGNRSIQLDDFDSTNNINRKDSFNGGQEIQEENDFFRRATHNSFLFKSLISKKSQ